MGQSPLSHLHEYSRSPLGSCRSDAGGHEKITLPRPLDGEGDRSGKGVHVGDIMVGRQGYHHRFGVPAF